MTRPRTSVFIAASLDGFIARVDGAVDWLSVVDREGEDYGGGAFFASVDTIVMGRKTYDTAIGFGAWPYARMRAVVVTSDASKPSRHGEEFYAGDLAPLLERLAAQGSKRVYVDGGTIIAQALRAKLVDDVVVSIIPMLLGAGTPLAPAIGHDVHLALVAHRAYESGLVQLEYRVKER